MGILTLRKYQNFNYFPDVKTFGRSFERITQNTAQKMKFSIKDFSSKCDQIPRKLRVWSHLLEKYLIENFIFCAVKLG